MMARKGTQDSPKFGKEVRIEHHYTEVERSQFVNHMVVQHSEKGEFHISFFEIIHPLISQDPEEFAQQVESLEKVDAHCVARIVVAGNRIPSFIAALADNYEKYLEKTSDPKATSAKTKASTSEQKGKKHAS